MKKPIVLDMDLDFFVKPIKHWAADEDPRLPADDYTVESEQAVRLFLEEALCLSREHPIPGKIIRHHKEVFAIWNRLIEEGRLTSPFSVLHVDAHEDVGGLGLQGRINSENFLTHAVRIGWIKEIIFILQEQQIGIPVVYLRHDPPRIYVEGQEAIFNHFTKENFDSAIFPRPDFFFLALSPAFTPQSADALIPIIREYIQEI